MKKLLHLLSLSIALICPTIASAQTSATTTPSKEELLKRLVIQNQKMPQERVHIVTDRNHYLTGDTIWMRAFLVDGLYKKPVHYSRFLYVELRNEADSLISRVKLHERPEKNDTVMRGYLSTAPELPTGIYTIAAYTQWMLNSGEELFFKRNVQLVNADDISKDIFTEPLANTTGCDAYHSVDSASLAKADDAVIVVHPLVQTEKNIYGSREMVTVKVQAPPHSSLAISVTDNAATQIDQRAMIHYSILGQPYWHNIDSIYAGKFREPTILNEISQEIRGTLRGTLRRQPKPNTMITLFSPSAKLFRMTRTDSLGNFCFENFDAPDTCMFNLRSFSDRGRGKGEIIIAPSPLPDVVHHLETPVKPATRTITSSSDSLLADKMKQRVRFSSGQWEITLDEVGVAAQKKLRGEDGISKFADRKLGYKDIQEMNVASLEDLLMQLPGVFITTDTAGNRIAKYRNKPLYFWLNDVEVSQSIREDESEFEYVNNYCNVNCIEYLDLVEVTYIGSTTARDFNSYGIRIKENPTLAKSSNDFNSITFKPLGHQVPHEFGQTDYSTQEKRFANPPGTDQRATLYWNPALEVDSTGIASFTFWTNDNYKTLYTIRVEGVSESGKLIDGIKRIKMQ